MCYVYMNVFVCRLSLFATTYSTEEKMCIYHFHSTKECPNFCCCCWCCWDRDPQPNATMHTEVELRTYTSWISPRFDVCVCERIHLHSYQCTAADAIKFRFSIAIAKNANFILNWFIWFSHFVQTLSACIFCMQTIHTIWIQPKLNCFNK